MSQTGTKIIIGGGSFGGELAGEFIVHFFSREQVERLAAGYKISSVEAFEEDELPRRFGLVAERKEN